VTSPPPSETGDRFVLDRFQIEAIDAIDAGDSVLVSAPTGSGKTKVAEHAIVRALERGRRAFYTTPIKALSNQKFHDLVRLHGEEKIGLLTGDTSINGDAPIVVMTTEVLRNMIYARSSALGSLDWVVLDEVHYLQDTYRGSVWEEVIIHLPEHVRLVCLSATVSNADELGEWLRAVRGPTTVVTESTRPVTLDNWYLVDDRGGEGLVLVPTHVDGNANDRAHRFDLDLAARSRGARRRYATPGRVETVELLAAREMLPAIHFIFSRAGCDEAVTACTRAGLRFTEDTERERIRVIAERHVRDLADDDLNILQYDMWLDSLQRGIASHHAGMVPPFKEAVERCFVEGLVKMVFATETLALGINMPARTVVIEKLTKFTGERHEFLTPAQYTQLTGRAGRRGIDDHGNALVLWSPFVPFDEVATLAGSRSFRLTSSFRPTYNMAANLVRRYDAVDAHRLLGLSFAQFQADADVLKVERRLHQRRAALESMVLDSQCELGEVGTYREALDRHRSPKGRRSGGAEIEAGLEGLRPGDVLWLEGSGGHDRVAVLSVSHRKGGSVRVKVLDARTNVVQLGGRDFDEAPVVVGRIDLPTPFTPTKTRFQREVASELTRFARSGRTGNGSKQSRSSRRVEETETRDALESHPVHDCPDRDSHLRAARDAERISREITDLERQVRSRTGSLVDQFDRILQMLETWGHLEGWSLTSRGERLVRIYHECDLLIAEAIEEGLFDDLEPDVLAGLASSFVYESRKSAPDLEPWFPNGVVARRSDDLLELAIAINNDESAFGLALTRQPDPAFFGLAHAWAAGDDLDRLLGDEEMPGGDFVRTVKQLVDLLKQMADTDTAASANAARAADALFRGVVAVSGTSRVGTGDSDADDLSSDR
jgi:ATP-dependent RNA helicase HelY